MNSKMTNKLPLQDFSISVKMKISALWTSFMFLYIYVDYFHLYMPGSLTDILTGKVYVFDISQTFLMAGLVSVTIPALMIFLSSSLPANINRWTNIVVATVYIPYTLFNVIGEHYIHIFFGAFVEVALLLLIITFAWKWPRIVS
jgi:hypothetical protein